MQNLIKKFWGSRANAHPKNVILIVIDALRHDGLSCFGNTRKTSPNIDSLARKGALFTQAFSASGSTPGSMGAIMTASYPLFHTEIFNKDSAKVTDFGYSRFYTENDRDGHFASGLPTLAEILRDNGFETAGFSTNPSLTRELNYARGFDNFEEFPDKRYWDPFPSAEIVSDHVKSRLSQRDGGNSFIYIHYMDGHHPYGAPHPFIDRFKSDFVDGKSHKQINEQWYGETDQEILAGISDHARALYDAQICYLDHHLGELFRFMRRKGCLNDTLVVIVSDHGEEFLEHGRTVHHPQIYDELVRIPLIIYCPGAIRKGRVPHLVRSVDILPTILDVLGIENQYSFDGCSLLPTLQGKEHIRPDFAYMDSPPYRGIRTSEWKLIRNEETKALELYNLESDPGETRNVAETNSEKASELVERLDTLCHQLARDSVAADRVLGEGTEVSEEIAKRLRSLGYL